MPRCGHRHRTGTLPARAPCVPPQGSVRSVLCVPMPPALVVPGQPRGFAALLRRACPVCHPCLPCRAPPLPLRGARRPWEGCTGCPPLRAGGDFLRRRLGGPPQRGRQLGASVPGGHTRARVWSAVVHRQAAVPRCGHRHRTLPARAPCVPPQGSRETRGSAWGMAPGTCSAFAATLGCTRPHCRLLTYSTAPACALPSIAKRFLSNSADREPLNSFQLSVCEILRPRTRSAASVALLPGCQAAPMALFAATARPTRCLCRRFGPFWCVSPLTPRTAPGGGS